MTDRSPCLHYAPIERATGCDLGRFAPRDCPACSAYEPEPNSGQAIGIEDIDNAERTRCEIWTRVMGYHRPVSAFNPGKQAEHAERKQFQEP